MATLPCIIFASLLCFQLCYSFPVESVNLTFAKFVLDGKNDCKILDKNSNIIGLFKLFQCPQYIKTYSENFFDQREILPCFGIYDSLYHLCEFPENQIALKVPEVFKDSKQFCVEAKRVYNNLNFSYNGVSIKKWSGALNKTMQDKNRCENMCIIDNIVNEQCVAMLSIANEYLRLMAVNSTEKVVNDKTADSKKKDVEHHIISSSSLVNTIKPDKTEKATSKIQSISLAKSKEANDSQKTSVLEINNKPAIIANKDSKPDIKNVEAEPVIASNREDKKDKMNLDNANEQNPAKTVETNPPLETSNIQKISQGSEDDGTEKTEQTATSQGIFQEQESPPIDNEEGIPPDASDKGFAVHRPPFPVSSPSSLFLKVHHTMISIPHTSAYEEIEKPSKDDKTANQETEHNIGLSDGPNEFNHIRSGLDESEDSYSFTYVITTMAALCAVYLLFHYRNKLMALALEGRKGKSSRGRGRPSSANYSKLHSNLEEAIASNVTAPSATHVLY